VSLLTFVTKLYSFFCTLIVEKRIVLVVIVEINKLKTKPKKSMQNFIFH